MGQEFRKGLAGQFSLGVPHTVAVRCQPGLDIQDGSLTWLAFGAGHWLGAWLVLLTKATMPGRVRVVEYLTWQLASSRVSVPKTLGKKCRAFSDSDSEVRSITSTKFYLAQRRGQPRFKGRKHRPPLTTSQWEEC